jgi:penicillin amidase
MRILFFLLSIVITIALIVVLGTTRFLPAPLGKLLSPQEGVWQNAEPTDKMLGEDLRFPELKGTTEVYFDERMVPHIFSDSDADAYFAMGYIHAMNRLWQMEFQTHYIAGRTSEIAGKAALPLDRRNRRLGITYAAERSLAMWEQDKELIGLLDSYTAGINAYIESLPESKLPVEYKLLGYKPEKWTNLKSVLFFKAMTYDLAGGDSDFEQTNLLKVLGEDDYWMLFPEVQDSLSPIIPAGTAFAQSATIPAPPADADSVYFHRTDSIWFSEPFKPNPGNGSNNWAVAGSKTASGKPILCNDPHLRLSLPAIWFEAHINTPTCNVYGVSLPGLPGVIIGFNEYVAFGMTNAGRDMKDYYEIRFKDGSRQEYWFENEWKKADLRVEKIQIKGEPEYLDTVAYTVFGPVMYDQSYEDRLKQNKAYALSWIAHKPSNPLRTWYHLNRAKGYDDYLKALQYFNEPSQNFVFATVAGDIAIKQEGNFPLRWPGQGNFVMPGQDSSYMWKEFIPRQDNPFIHNPDRGFVSSANQRPVDSTYPYFIPGNYDLFRGMAVNRNLSAMSNITPDDMKRLQNNNYDLYAEQLRPVLLKYLDRSRLSADAARFVALVEKWDLNRDIDRTAPTVFDHWSDSLHAFIFKDEFSRTDLPVVSPKDYIMVQYLIRDSTSFKFIDNIKTNNVETLTEAVTVALLRATEELKKLEGSSKLAWGAFKNTTIYHLLQNSMLPFARTSLPIGGGKNIINATTHAHGPSWKMVVHMTSPVEAYGIYPGGQSGNPGSPYYDNSTMDWAKGKHYKLWIMRKEEKNDKRIKGTLTFKS